MRALLAHDRGRDHVPAEMAGEDVGRYLALVQRAAGKIVQRDFIMARLVHPVTARAVFASKHCGEGVIRAPWNELDTLDDPALEQSERIVRERCWLGQEQRGCHSRLD